MKMANILLGILNDETVKKTIVRSVITAAKPKIQSFIHKSIPKESPRTTPKIRNNIHIIHPTKERAKILLRIKIGSLTANLLKTQSKNKVIAKSPKLSSRSVVMSAKGKNRTYRNIPMRLQRPAIINTDLLMLGRENKDP